MIDITKKDIERLYLEEGKTMTEIAQLYGVSYSTIRLRIIQYNIPIKPRGNYKDREYHTIPYNRKDVDDRDKEEFISMFCNYASLKEMSKRFGVSRKSIERKIAELGLKRDNNRMYSREQYDSSNDEEIVRLYNEGMSTTQIGKIFGIGHRSVSIHLEHNGVERRSIRDSQYAHNNKEIPSDIYDYEKMYDMYIVNRMTKKDIADQYGTNGGTVDRSLRFLGIPVRGCSEAKTGLYTGKEAGNYKDGRTPIYARLRMYFRLHQIKPVLKRDNYTCQMCGSHKKLQVHHIVYFKDIFNSILKENQNLDPVDNADELYKIITKDSRMNDLDNLITYCKECHLYKVHRFVKLSEE